MRKLTIEHIKNKASETRVEILSSLYTNNYTKLKFKCSQGHEFSTPWHNFERHGCPRCAANKSKKDIEEIREYALRKEYTLLSNKYINNKSKLSFICKKRGHTFKLCWNDLQHGCGCKECRKEDRSHIGVKKLNIPIYDTYAPQIDFCEEVRRSPINEDYLQVRCTNCNEWFMPKKTAVCSRIYAVNNVNQGENRFYCSEDCKKGCSLFGQRKYFKGEEPSSYRPGQSVWADMIKERDNYECQICGETEGINAHHYEGLNVNDMQSLDLDMGVTLCAECHHRAHTGSGCTYHDLTKNSLCNGESNGKREEERRGDPLS